MAIVTKRFNYNNGNSRGIEHPKLFVYHSLYEVKFPNGWTEDLTVNVIDKNMLFHVDSEEYH